MEHACAMWLFVSDLNLFAQVRTLLHHFNQFQGQNLIKFVPNAKGFIPFLILNTVFPLPRGYKLLTDQECPKEKILMHLTPNQSIESIENHLT